jgi:hypothetical protein
MSYNNAVLESQASDLEGLEELGNFVAAVFHSERGSGCRVLLWCEVRDLYETSVLFMKQKMIG